MSKITIAPRTGKDLFDFLRTVEVDVKTAKTWALETFVKIDDQPITIEQIAKLRNDIYIILSEKVFTLNLQDIVEEDNIGVHYAGITIKKNKIHRDFITEIQAIQSKSSAKNNIGIIKNFITKFFNVGYDEIDNLPYELVGYMFRHCNDFLSQITKPTNELHLDDIFVSDSGGTHTGIVDNMV